MSTESSRLVVCQITPELGNYSETFIHAHLRLLPFDVRMIYGRNLSVFRKGEDNEPLLPFWMPNQFVTQPLVYKVVRNLGSNFSKNGLKRYLRANTIDVVLAEYGTIGVQVMGICQELQIPLVVHFHGHDAYDQRVLSTAGRGYSELFSSATAIVAVSKDMVRQLIGLGAEPRKVFYNPYGIDLSLFGGAQPEKAPPTFISVGRFVDKKAPHLTILAWAEVVKQMTEAKLVMIGDGVLLESVRALAGALNVLNSVDFLGVLPHDEVAIAMRNARAYVQHSICPSYGDSEGTPVSILEACATGLPIISTKHGGIQDVVEDGETGFLVDEMDVRGMADKMLQLAHDSDLAGKMGRAARTIIKEKFLMEDSINNLAHIITQANPIY